MQLTNMAHAMAFVGLLVACGAGGAGTIDVSDDPAGPFSGLGKPGRASCDNPGIFVPGAPGVGSSTEITSLLGGFCDRVHTRCAQTSATACVATFQGQWNNLKTDCERGLYYTFLTCLINADVTCNSNGQATISSCVAPVLSLCDCKTGGSGGTTGGSGGTTGGTGGSNTGGTGGTGTGGAGATGGTGGSGGNTGGTGGTATGGTGGNTGGTGGTGGGRGGTGGTGGTGGRGGRDGGRG
jgi:hypothetical protein